MLHLQYKLLFFKTSATLLTNGGNKGTAVPCELRSTLPGCFSPWQRTPSSYPAVPATRSGGGGKAGTNVMVVGPFPCMQYIYM